MTRQEVEIALIQMGEAVETIVGAFDPEANHITIDIIDGQISIYACKFDNETETTVKDNILNAVSFSDGVLRIGGKYIYPRERQIEGKAMAV